MTKNIFNKQTTTNNQKPKILYTNLLEYMKFLEEYTTKESRLTTNIHLLKDDMTENEINYILMLNQLFEIINNYCKENHIYPSKNKYGTYYLIEYNNIGYYIGHFNKKESNTYFCIRTRINSNHKYIPINTIIHI